MTPIPTPPALRWREFRIQALPLLTFIAVLLVVGVMWSRYVMPSNVVAEVEAVRAGILSPTVGTLKELKVARFQRVTKGQEIAMISSMDGDTLKAEIAAVQADLRVLKARMQLDIDRNLSTYEETRLEYLKERVELAVQKANLKYYESEVARQRPLLTNTPPLVSMTEFEWFLREAEATRVSVDETERYLAEKEKTLPKLVPNATDLANDPIAEAIRAQEEKLRVASEPVILKAPFDGMVTTVTTFSGQKVTEGLPLVIISSTTAERIIGYVKQPVTAKPKVGDVVQVRRRAFQREAAASTVLEVGAQFEPMPATLLAPDVRAGRDVGLPFIVKLPAGMNLMPGEAVDVILHPKLARAQ
jgi:multidrug resistance efflux pump